MAAPSTRPENGLDGWVCPRPRTTQRPPHAPQAGETLVGLLVGMAVGWVVMAAGTQWLARHLQGHRWALQDSHLHHDLRGALDIIGRDVRQAQGIGQAWRKRSSATCQDPFCASTQDLRIAGERIDFSLDRNQNGLLENNECMGFRLKAHKLQTRTACTPEVWSDLTDAGSLKLVNLQWQLHCEQRGIWLNRWVTVQLQAEWPRDASRSLRLSNTIALRNEVPAQTWPLGCGARS